ncbi:patatin-like phospholipase family protein [Xanthobacter versatilis]|uniref:patatin-like phospholipase family protein n=1 Tax=Xanthobacter autotrophicus (strain ATCC BAA-1158 / Py2) TaxID=78245 RepID=UPI00372CBB30
MSEVEEAGYSVSRDKPALALSGGGFRATLFHAGAIVRLNDLGLLTRIARISSVSGGSITSGRLAQAWPRLTPKDGVFTNLWDEVVEPLRAFCGNSVDLTAIGLGALLPGKGVGDVLADIYDRLLDGITLQDLPDTPQFVFNATNLKTGRLVRLQKSRIADFTIGEIPSPTLRVAVAVAASSAFPPVLSPVEIRLDPAAWRKFEGAVHYDDRAYKERLSLTDGGAYDNLGLETVDRFDPVIVSDAGAPFASEETSGGFWPKQLFRVLDIATDQARSLRKRLLFAEAGRDGRTAVYAGIDRDPSAYPAPRLISADPAVIASLAAIRTRLDAFSASEQKKLINWGWLIMDLAARSFVATGVPSPEKLPFPDAPLG